MRRAISYLLSSILLLSGCSSVPNQPLNSLKLPLEARQSNATRAATFASAPPPVDQDGTFVGIAISGGGLRSANFSAGVLFQLQKIGLLQRVDYISSVSGGSMTGAYYCSADDEHWDPATVQHKMTHRFASDIAVNLFLPWNSVALVFTDYNTNDILTAAFDRELFTPGGRSLTFADLRADRPRLLVNATDLQSGQRFVFCNETFNELNSDLSKFRLADAVAASGAFPIVLHEKTLRDYSTIFSQYRHFIDGGVTDNLGIQSLLDTYAAQNAPGADGKSTYPHGAVFIVIDAGNRYDAHLSDKSSISFWERIYRHADLATTALLNRASNASLSDLLLLHASASFNADDLRKQHAQLEDTGLLMTRDRFNRPVRVIHISLTRLHRLSNLPFPTFGETVQTISTFYNISETEAYYLHTAADLLVNEPRTYEALESALQDLRGR